MVVVMANAACGSGAVGQWGSGAVEACHAWAWCRTRNLPRLGVVQNAELATPVRGAELAKPGQGFGEAEG